MTIAQGILMEFEREAETTRRVLDRIPPEKYGWKPHAKSFSLGQLAMHMIQSLDTESEAATQDVFEFYQPPAMEPRNPEELIAAYERSTAKVKEIIGKIDDARMISPWTGTFQGKTLMSVPRLAFIRTVILNHHYHHRGQLSVYLRLLDVPVPHIYGPSANDNPFLTTAAAH